MPENTPCSLMLRFPSVFPKTLSIDYINSYKKDSCLKIEIIQTKRYLSDEKHLQLLIMNLEKKSKPTEMERYVAWNYTAQRVENFRDKP